MSGILDIRFAEDMPAAAVEVVAPDLSTVERVWIQPRGHAAVAVPSEASFLRVYLPSGRIVTLDQPGKLDRLVSYADLERSAPAERVRKIPPSPGSPGTKGLGGSLGVDGGTEKPADTRDTPDDVAPSDDEEPVWIRFSRFGERHHGIHPLERAEEFQPPRSEEPYSLSLTARGIRAEVQLPGYLAAVAVRTERSASGRLVIQVRLRSTNRVADTLCGYLSRGDLYSAAAWSQSAASAEVLLERKRFDPFGAAVGGYLLLRLRRLDLLHDWTRNLADFYPHLADGAVIRAWHLIHAGDPTSEPEIRERLRQAAGVGLPVFTEGLQLLGEGLRLLGEQELQQKLDARSGVVEWKSPLTTTLYGAGEKDRPVDVDVDYGSFS